jgi:hypothetical protein
MCLGDLRRRAEAELLPNRPRWRGKATSNPLHDVGQGIVLVPTKTRAQVTTDFIAHLY